MTLRERIADWISGGALTKEILLRSVIQDDLDEANNQVKEFAAYKRLYRTRLNRISAMETPRCANIGKRMARVARGEEG